MRRHFHWPALKYGTYLNPTCSTEDEDVGKEKDRIRRLCPDKAYVAVMGLLVPAACASTRCGFQQTLGKLCQRALFLLVCDGICALRLLGEGLHVWIT
jgi:hypothetical protein